MQSDNTGLCNFILVNEEFLFETVVMYKHRHVEIFLLQLNIFK